MTPLTSRKYFLIFFFLIFLSASCCRTSGQMSYPEQEVRVQGLPAVTARSSRSSDVLAASLEMVFDDKEICCGKNSALEDSVQSPDPKSLKDIAGKLQGRHHFSDGRPILVTAEFLTPEQVTASHLIYMLKEKHAALMMWKSHLYVVDGVTYVENIDPDGAISYVTHKFLLEDARFSGARSEVTFDRTTEDGSKVQGLLFLQAAPQ